ncbi:MAG: GerAB/ArcD/ProY family transporter [Candidatus Carbobacillus altaicus]|nr:GerAB/ArcD/ProY family transporter [Candidatus Carbobacillus altaicus]
MKRTPTNAQDVYRTHNPSTNDKIGFRELIAIDFFLLGVKGTDTTVPFFYEFAGNAAWLMPLFIFLFILPFVLLVSRLLARFEGKNLLIISEHLIGRPLTYLAAWVLFLLGMAATVLNTRSYTQMTGIMFYGRTPLIFLYAVILLATAYVAYRGLETIGRVASLLLPYALFSIVLAFLGVYDIIDYRAIFPLFGQGWSVLPKTVTHLGFVVDIFYFALFAGLLKSGSRTYQNATLIGTAMAGIGAMGLIFMYTGVFGYPAVNQVLFHYQQLTRIAHYGQFINHIEAAFLGTWILATVVHFAIYIYTMVYLLHYLVRAKDMFRLFVPIVAAIFFAGLYPYRSEKLFFTYREWIVWALTATVYPYLLLLVLLSRTKGGKKRARKKTAYT